MTWLGKKGLVFDLCSSAPFCSPRASSPLPLFISFTPFLLPALLHLASADPVRNSSNITLPLCGILIENGLHRGIYPRVQSTVGRTVQEGVEGVALLDEMHIIGGRLQGVKRTHHSLLALFASFLWIMMEALSYHYSTMPVCLLPYFLT